MLLGPLRLTLLVGALWAVGALGWAALDLVLFTGRLAVKTGLTCLLGAGTTCTIVYLLSERLLRRRRRWCWARSVRSGSGCPG
ncbi:hypothetical protein ACFQY7_43960 [Actinomadura luteofluorescens]|uniref:hypothetical protein n=1 Tax=Actinomadura luteofluorescens TaxID=46163 RepID=UPI0036321647